jgi:hypothetical protein
LHRAVSEDLGRRPRLLLIFRNARDLPANGYRRLDYIAYFSGDRAVASILREYRLVASTGDYLIYQWVPPGAPGVGPTPAATPGAQDIVQVADIARPGLAVDPAFLAGLAAFVGGLVAAWRTRRHSAARPTPEDPPQPHLADDPPVE